LAYHPEGRQLALADRNGRITVWDVSSGNEIVNSPSRGRDPNGIRAVAYSPDGKRLVAAGSSTVMFLDSHTGQEMLVPPARQFGAFGDIAFSPDGQQMAITNSRGILVWDARPLTPELRVEREALDLVRYLCNERLFLPEQVREAIRQDQTLSDAVRQKALVLAERYCGDAGPLNQRSWPVVVRPGYTDERYRLALRQAEAACRVEPDNCEYLNTLGVALYRVGQYQKALETLTRSDQLAAEAYGSSLPRDLAFAAMSYFQLDRREQAQVYLGRLRVSLKDRNVRNVIRALLREAESLIEGKVVDPKE
jgi:tetratricopeptide (TPR) repeat protein